MKAELIDILLEIKLKVTEASDMMWTTYETPQSLQEELDRFIHELSNDDLGIVKEINVHFLPTGTFQEHAMQNGWTDEYMILAERFDKLYATINI